MGPSGRDRGAKGGEVKGSQGGGRVRGKLGCIKNPSNQGEIAPLLLDTCFGNKDLVAGLRQGEQNLLNPIIAWVPFSTFLARSPFLINQTNRNLSLMPG